MTLTCEEARDRILENRGDLPAGESELRSHLESCGACASHASRTVRVATALAALRRAPAPRELEGLAVATFHEGHRQDRAVSILRSLGRLSTPQELSGRTLRSGRRLGRPVLRTDLTDGGSGARAPAVLDRLVDENLRRGSADAGRRFASRLDRLRAPRVLRGRIESSARFFLGAHRARGNRVLAAAAVLVLFGGGLWIGLRAAKEASSATDFQVRHETSLDALDPMARSLLGGLSGGLVDAPRRRP